VSDSFDSRRDAIMADIERTMRDLVAKQLPERGGRMVMEQLVSGGKRIRPRIAVAAAEALGVPRRAAVSWAAAIELLHNATLVHDDVQDGDRYRRGRPTLWARHGAAQAINAGDALLMLPFLALEGVAPSARGALSSLLASFAIETVRGQIAEIDLLPEERLDWASYVEAAMAKTGALFALPIAGIAILAGVGEHEAGEVGDPLRRFGVAFQIQDDVLDLYGDKGRDAAGSDLREGKVSALVVAHLERRPEDRAWLLDLLRAPRDATPQAGIDRATIAFRESGALGVALDRASVLRAAAERAAAWCERPQLVSALARVFDACVPATDVALRGVA
jgi:geranylgeranyl pyrophosphate synthase